MSRFYASIRGQSRTPATRRGSAKSAISGHIRGWKVGIRVHGFDNNGVDTFRVELTSGSGGYKGSKILGVFTEKDLDLTLPAK